MRTRTEYLFLLRPWSLPAFGAAFMAVMFAATMQEIIASFGMTPYFAGFVPAILVAGLLGGAPAGTFATLLSIPIVWWAFMPQLADRLFFPPVPRSARPDPEITAPRAPALSRST